MPFHFCGQELLYLLGLGALGGYLRLVGAPAGAEAGPGGGQGEREGAMVNAAQGGVQGRREGFTPGPWMVDGAPGRYFVEGGDLGPICALRYLGNTPAAEAMEAANARLIAAAPELYALAAEAARVSCECDDQPGACFPCRSRALLARVQGEGAGEGERDPNRVEGGLTE